MRLFHAELTQDVVGNKEVTTVLIMRCLQRVLH